MRFPWKRGRLAGAVFFLVIALLFAQAAPALAAQADSLTFSFTVTSEPPPAFSLDGLAGVGLTTGSNEFTLMLNNPENGMEYSAVGTRLMLVGAAPYAGELTLNCEENGTWTELQLQSDGANLFADVGQAAPLAKGSSIQRSLRLDIGPGLRGENLILRAQAYSDGAEIAGAAKDFSFTVGGPKVQVKGDLPTFGVNQEVGVDLLVTNPTGRTYSATQLLLTLSKDSGPVPDGVLVRQEVGGSWQDVPLTVAESGAGQALLQLPQGTDLAAGAEVVVSLKLYWPAGSNGTYSWQGSLVRDAGTADAQRISQDSLGSFQVLVYNLSVSLSADTTNFGEVTRGTKSKAVTLTVKNTGNVTEKVTFLPPASITSAGTKYTLGVGYRFWLAHSGQEHSLGLRTYYITLAPGEETTLLFRVEPVTLPVGSYTVTFQAEASLP